MTTIALKQFDGMYPVVNARLLKEDAATVATNAKITGGSIKAWKNATTVQAQRRVGDVRTIYLFDGTSWFEWLTDVDVVRGPIAGDTLERTYYTGDGEPKATSNAIAIHATNPMPAASYRLGVPPPVTGPSLAVSGTGDGTPAETRYYVFTYVTAWGEEGPPSEPVSIDVINGQTVNITGLATGPSGNYQVTSKRIYRTSTGSQAADFQFVTELALASTTYDDTKTGAELAEVMVSATWYPPRSTVHNEPGVYSAAVTSPSPYTMVGLTQMANGILAGFAHNIVCFSEVGQPHAWPRQYEQTTDKPIVGIGAFGQSLAVLTQSYPYVATGVDPSAMSMQRLELMQACVSKRSIVEMGDGVIYASPDGLVSISARGAELITKNLFTRDEWQAYAPESIHAYQHDGRYFAFYDTGTAQGCLVFSFNGQEPSFVTLSLSATAGFVDPVTDALYLVVGTNIVKFDTGSALTYTWRSKRFTLPSLQNLGAAQVLAKAYPVTLGVYGYDSTYTYSVAVASSAPIRLPATVRYRDVELQVSGTAEVEQILIASSIEELRRQ